MLRLQTFILLSFALLVHGEEGCSVQEGSFWRHPHFEKQANQKDDSLYRKSNLDPIAFWAECASGVDWFESWDNVFSWTCPYARWFEGGKLNLSFNCLDRHLKDNRNKIAFIWCNEKGDEKFITYEEIYKEVCRLANGLKSLGVKKGDVVSIYMPMTPEGIASMLACARIGAVHSVIFGGTGAGSTKEKINDAKAKVIITADVGFRRGKEVRFQSTIDRILPECPTVQHVIVLQRALKPQTFSDQKYLSYHYLIESSSEDCPPESVDAEDMLFVLYTSGTTGKPKGIVHTTGGYLVGVFNTFKWVFDYKPSDVFWCTADIGWITGHSYVVYGPMSNGATQIIYEGTFDYPAKDQAWKIAEKYKATIFYTAPTLIRTFMKWGHDLVSAHDLSSLRLIGSIGEPLNPEAWEWYSKYIGRDSCPIVDTWFQTETGALVIAPIPGITPLKPGSVTQALPGFKADILNEAGEPVSHGFLALTAPYPSMMRGILNDPIRYYNSYWAKWNGRYYFAGDDSSKDEDGYIWIRGRADEVIKVSGHRIGTAEIENAIIEHPSVSEAAVVGIKDEIKGQKIIALVVLKEDAEPFADISASIAECVVDFVGKYAQPEIICFVADLPKTRSGKILRRVISNLIDGGNIGDISTLQNPEVIQELEKVCAEIKHRMAIQ